jgi:hypothetical protein
MKQLRRAIETTDYSLRKIKRQPPLCKESGKQY